MAADHGFKQGTFAYEDLKDFENRIIYYESSRGCPFSCSYCLSSVDKKLRFRDLELVKKETSVFPGSQSTTGENLWTEPLIAGTIMQ